jgi:DNA-binding MurR/RpiR family transcriptional regulator
VTLAGPGVLDLFQGVRLTPTQRRIAHCLVEHATAAAYLSATEIADLAKVSQPSVTRFAIALGYEGYPALRQRLRIVLSGDALRKGDASHRNGTTADSGPPRKPGAPGTPLDGTDANALQLAVHAEMDNLRRLADRLADPAPVAAAGALLAASRPLPVLGLRAAAPLAAYFGYFAAKVHPDVRVLDHGGSLLADRLEQARAAGATAMLAIVLPRYPREALDTLREARAAGLSVVAVTDSPVSPAADLADVTLPAAVGSQLVFDLHAAPMAMAMVLLQAICDAVPAEAQLRLEEFEHSATRRHVFTP